jgi:hypothetical protein
MNAGHKFLLALGGCLAIGSFSHPNTAYAAETVVLTYGFLAMEIPVADLVAFAEQGETSDELDQLLNQAGQSPESLRNTLTEPIALSPVVADLALNSLPGEFLLDRISETIQPASGQAGRLALRSAVIGAAADDNQITLLEVMQVYPSPEIVVDGNRLLETYNRLYEVIGPLEDLVEVLRRQEE